MAKKKDKIRVIYKRVGFDPVAVEIDNTLKQFQHMVGGYIEAVPCSVPVQYAPTVIICDEDGKIDGRALNFVLPGGHDVICGAAVICGVDGDEFDDVKFGLAELHAFWPDLFDSEEV